MELVKKATFLGLIGMSLIFFSYLVQFCIALEYGDALTLSLMLLTLIGEGLLLAFFIIMYRRHLLHSDE